MFDSSSQSSGLGLEFSLTSEGDSYEPVVSSFNHYSLFPFDQRYWLESHQTTFALPLSSIAPPSVLFQQPRRDLEEQVESPQTPQTPRKMKKESSTFNHFKFFPWASPFDVDTQEDSEESDCENDSCQQSNCVNPGVLFDLDTKSEAQQQEESDSEENETPVNLEQPITPGQRKRGPRRSRTPQPTTLPEVSPAPPAIPVKTRKRRVPREAKPKPLAVPPVNCASEKEIRKLDKVRLASAMLSTLPMLGWLKQKEGVFFQLLPEFRGVYGQHCKIVSETDLSRGWDMLVGTQIRTEFEQLEMKLPKSIWPKDTLLRQLVEHIETAAPGLNLTHGLNSLYMPTSSYTKSKQAYSKELPQATLDECLRDRGHNKLIIVGNSSVELEDSEISDSRLVSIISADSQSAIDDILNGGGYDLIVLHDSILSMTMSRFDLIFSAACEAIVDHGQLHFMASKEFEEQCEESGQEPQESLLLKFCRVEATHTNKSPRPSSKRQKTCSKCIGSSCIVSKIIEGGFEVDSSSPMLTVMSCLTRGATERYISWFTVFLRASDCLQSLLEKTSTKKEEQRSMVLRSFVNVLRNLLLVDHCAQPALALLASSQQAVHLDVPLDSHASSPVILDTDFKNRILIWTTALLQNSRGGIS